MTSATTLKHHARQLRREQTPWEVTLWHHLRRRQVHGTRFLRQKVVADYILDFYAPSIRLAIELDGSQHYEPHHQRADRDRDDALASRGIRVLRFTNAQVTEQIDDVLEEIWRETEKRIGN